MEKGSKPTIYQVAEKAGVSRQTVSRVINNRPDVADETRKRVLDIIAELDYRPNAVARSLSKQRTFNFGLVTAGLEFIGPSVTMSGITKKTEQLGYGLYLKELPRFNAGNVPNIIDWFLARQVDGIIWAVPEIGNNRDWIDDFVDQIRVPIIFLTAEEREGISTVTIDNYYGAKLATEHLLNCGRRKIGHISGPLDWWEARQRYSGWRDALLENGITPEDSWVAEGNWSSKSGKKAFEQLLDTFLGMDAVFAANDQMALSVLQTACEKKIQVPVELSVMGFDAIPESEFFTPSLTTIVQNLLDLGSMAVQQLVQMVEMSNSKIEHWTPIYLSIKPELIVRKSTVVKE